jgi:hypothetical protein
MWEKFSEGILHITNINGYDHMLFLLALCAPFTSRQWRPVLFLATAFTLGHSVSLALAAYDVVRFPGDTIELLIAISIVITALFNLVTTPQKVVVGGKAGDQGINSVSIGRNIVTAAFGIVHGLGFSSFFRMMYDETGPMVRSLLFFNLGVEAGQVMIIAAIFLVIHLFMKTFRLPGRSLRIGLSLIALGLSLGMTFQRI